MLYNNILETIGHTPIVRINRLAPKDIEMYVKIEARNPGGSVKDRLAYAIITDAERKGLLKPGQTVVEATSGNTGIALAMVCAAKGYPFIAVMTETFSVERRKLIRSFGGKVILTPAAEKGQGMVRIAKELAEKNNWFLANQFANPANPQYHRETTAAEILRDFAGKRLDYFVSGYGTGGTISGTGEILKAARPQIEIIATEPVNAQLLAGKEWAAHKIQGWTPDFIAETMNENIYDYLIPVGDEEARDTALSLATQEGIQTGISGGATFNAALQFAQTAPKNSVILTMLPDGSERYMSTFLFESINEGSDDNLLP
ncbi:cysteine synthase A [Suttonella ornithocola]|uniref:Cysteine synthase n=1 Tax=Suttonella ornithocola TaxID=279832 RepID=A0A380N033_9GAMM|nr:cysteine synthase A [Suttonella ornithocola]SUO97932.1 Cysteine synthase [Suttonella ornithocola]